MALLDFLMRKSKESISLDEAAQILKTDPELLRKFDEKYQECILSETDSDNLFTINAKQVAEEKEGIEARNCSQNIIDKIVEELISQTSVWKYDGRSVSGSLDTTLLPETKPEVTKTEVMSIPEKIRPQFTGFLMQRDIKESSYKTLLFMFEHYEKAKVSGNINQMRESYGMFRQGLDILDVDNVMYDMIGRNRNSMGYWLPKIIGPVTEQGFFKIPATTIIKVPLTMLQLTRQDYMSFNRTTLDIVDQYCQKVFGLNEDKEYFIKTGTYSSKFDFRNAHVHGAKEVRELGEYLLFIHWQALQMASPLTQPHPIYGVSTTNEWVVRDFIQDKENNPTIYKGMPLHTEYRVFVDFDTKQILGIHTYWDSVVMKKRFAEDHSLHDRHDYIIYSMHEQELYRRYEINKQTVLDNISPWLSEMELTGQWSIDIMQNGEDFWLIDMAVASESAFYKETVAPELWKRTEENWLPE